MRIILLCILLYIICSKNIVKFLENSIHNLR